MKLMKHTSFLGLVNIQLFRRICHDGSEFRIAIKCLNAVYNVAGIHVVTLPVDHDLMSFECRTARKMVVDDVVEILCGLKRKPKLLANLGD